VTTPVLTPSALATQAELAELGVGLAAASNLSVRSWYAHLLGGGTQLGGPFARAELGTRLTDSLSAFAGGGWERTTGWGGGVGLRWEWP
jgi:uncharacterized membrane protein